MPGLSFAKIVAGVELLNAALKPQLAELPHLQGESEDLDQLVTEVKSLNQEQEQVRGRLRELTRLRQEAERRSNDLRSRVVAQLRGKLGFTNENLIAFGIPPRKPARKPLPAAPQPEPHPEAPIAVPEASEATKGTE